MNNPTQIPLLHDHHTHPLLYASFAQGVSLLEIESKSEANDLIVDASKKRSGSITLAFGWRSNRYQWTDEELELLPPLAIFNVSLHELKLNQTGMSLLKNHYGEIAENVRDQDWYEDHFRLVLNWFANLYASADALNHYFEDLMKLGVYSAEELLLIDEREIELFRETELTDRTKFWAAPDTFETLSRESKHAVHGLKLFTDGAFGARTAAISRPFINDPSGHGNFGNLLYSNEDFFKLVNQCLTTEKSLAIHAIGDRSISQTIEALKENEQLVRAVPEVRIEHAQLIDEANALRAKQLGVKLSMQPNFSADSVDYADRLDAEFCQANNPFRMLIDKAGFVPGADLIFGSDGMPHGAKFALEQSLLPSIPNQQMSLEEFRSGYCLNDDSYGTIEFENSEDKTINVEIKI